MNLIIINPDTGQLTIMLNTHTEEDRGENIDCALKRYCAANDGVHRNNIEWMEFKGPLTLNFL